MLVCAKARRALLPGQNGFGAQTNSPSVCDNFAPPLWYSVMKWLTKRVFRKENAVVLTGAVLK
jgi:hypothetical protein